MYDVVIVGAGPAGLSAALVLGRCRRQVLLCDAGTPRNASATALHGFLTRDGIPPRELLRLGREELKQYDIHIRDARVSGIEREAQRFAVTIDESDLVQTRTVLLATGVRDRVPAIPGVDDCYGISVHHCPYCDGWEHRNEPLAVVGHGSGAAGLARLLKTWSDQITLCSNGPSRLTRQEVERLHAEQIVVRPQRVLRLEHQNGRVVQLILDGVDAVHCRGVFFSTGQEQQADFAKRLGCDFTHKGTVKTDNLGETCVPGVYVVGDASRDVQFAIVAAAEGAKAGVAINKALQAQGGRVVWTGS